VTLLEVSGAARFLAFVHGDSLQFIQDPGPHLQQPMPMPQRLSQIAIRSIRYPHSRKAIFQHQLQQELGIQGTGLLAAHPVVGQRQSSRVKGADIAMQSFGPNSLRNSDKLAGCRAEKNPAGSPRFPVRMEFS
jgi:hypothetical protein